MWRKCLRPLASAAVLVASPALAVQTPITINLINLGGVTAGSAVYNNYRAAADYWQSVLTTSQPTVINIGVGFDALGPGILGSTSSNFTTAPIAAVEGLLKFGQTTALDAVASRNLPTLGNGVLGSQTALSVYTPGYTIPDQKIGIDNSQRVYDSDGSYNNSVIGLTTANAKALGLATDPNELDAAITFSSDFSFDFNSSDGIADNSYDFLGVSIHEFGHALGFVSGVDDYDVLGTGGPLAMEDCGGILCQNYPANNDWFGETLDLFRYSDKGALDWTTGTSSYFSINGGSSAFNGGYFSTGTYNGDGSQASHWIDNTYYPRTNPACSNTPDPGGIGVMNPTAGACEQAAVTGLDLAAFDAIGYNTPIDVLNTDYRISTADIARMFGAVPEPATWATMVLGFAACGYAMRRRKVVLA